MASDGKLDPPEDNPLLVGLIEEPVRHEVADHTEHVEHVGGRKRSYWHQRRQTYRDRQRALKREVKERQAEILEAAAGGGEAVPESAESAAARQRVAAMLEHKARRRNWAKLSLEEVEWGRPRLVIDLEWDYSAIGMTHKELCSLVSQISFTYGVLRRCATPLPLHLVGTESAAGVVLRSVQTSHYWKVFRSEHSFMDVFEAEREHLVYLTPDSPDVLETISPDDIYILGGIADHNRLKGSTYTKACNLGIRTARLPIAEHLNVKMANSLAINHVANIICNYVTTSDWVSALEQAIPQRSGMRLTPGKDSRFKLRKAASDARHKVADAAREEEQQQQQQQSTCTTSTSSTCSNSTMRPE